MHKINTAIAKPVAKPVAKPKYIKEPSVLVETDKDTYDIRTSSFLITVNTNGKEEKCSKEELSDAMRDFYEEMVPQCFLYKGMTQEQGEDTLVHIKFPRNIETGPSKRNGRLHSHATLVVESRRSMITMNLPVMKAWFNKRLGFTCYVFVSYAGMSAQQFQERYLYK